MIIVDTGAMLALLDAGEVQHRILKKLYEENVRRWILPAAILPEIDYLISTHLGTRAQETFLDDLASGAFLVEWGRDEDLSVAYRICKRYSALKIGFVDAIVIATAERLNADAIVTLDLRHFGSITIKGNPRLLPRDLH
jgi:predicted nucleic acid-binding protein